MTTALQSKILLVLILALAAFLRFYLLDGQSFWNDEGNSVRIAEKNQAMYYSHLVDPGSTPLPVYDAMRSYTQGK